MQSALTALTLPLTLTTKHQFNKLCNHYAPELDGFSHRLSWLTRSEDRGYGCPFASITSDNGCYGSNPQSGDIGFLGPLGLPQEAAEVCLRHIVNREAALLAASVPHGKESSPCNAVRHGLTTETVIGSLEDLRGIRSGRDRRL